MPANEIATEGLRSFFETLQALSAASDIDALAAMYAPTVMIAGPNGTRTVAAAEMLQAIPKRQQLFKSAGHRRTTLVGFEEHVVTNRYSLVKADWQWEFQGPGDALSVVTLPSTFLVDRAGEAPHIFVYVMHHDIGEELRQRGLLPPAA